MAELADAPDLGSGAPPGVGVRVPLLAPILWSAQACLRFRQAEACFSLIPPYGSRGEQIGG